MQGVLTRTRIALGAAAVLALLIVPVALAADGGGSSDVEATASGVKNKVKKLTKRVAALEQQLAGLQGEQGDPRPPTGPAGGDLTGTYPNPLIAPNAVASAEVEDNTLTQDDLADDSVGSGELQNDSVGRNEIAAGGVGPNEINDNIVPRFGTVPVTGGAAQNGAYVIEQASASCLAGEELISGTAWWLNDANPGSDEELFVSEVEMNNGADSISAQFGNDSGTDRVAVAQANCLL